MNYGELKSLVADWGHRSDLSSRMDTFKQNVEERICERFGYAVTPSLVNDLDTNVVLTDNQLLYIYGMLEELSVYVTDAASAQSYRLKWDDTANRVNLTSGGWVGGNTQPPKIQPWVDPEVT